MPLIVKNLASSIEGVLNAGLQSRSDAKSKIPAEIAIQLANAYGNWVLSSFPTPPFTFVSPPISQLISAQLISLSFDGWGPGLVSFWSPTTVTAPGFLPANPLDPGTLATLSAKSAAVTAQMKANGMLFSSTGNRATPSEVANKMATALFTFTTGMMYMTTTISVPPVVAMFPVL